jgi:hypothetical protein
MSQHGIRRYRCSKSQCHPATTFSYCCASRTDLNCVHAAHDELKLTDVVFHTKLPRGVVVEAKVNHHSLHARGRVQTANQSQRK